MANQKPVSEMSSEDLRAELAKCKAYDPMVGGANHGYQLKLRQRAIEEALQKRDQ